MSIRYQGPKFQLGLKRVCRQINLEIVKRSDAGKFVVLPKRWIVAHVHEGGQRFHECGHC